MPNGKAGNSGTTTGTTSDPSFTQPLILQNRGLRQRIQRLTDENNALHRLINQILSIISEKPVSRGTVGCTVGTPVVQQSVTFDGARFPDNYTGDEPLPYQKIDQDFIKKIMQLNKCQRTILELLRCNPDKEFTKTQIAELTRYNITSGYFHKAIQVLTTQKMILHIFDKQAFVKHKYLLNAEFFL